MINLLSLMLRELSFFSGTSVCITGLAPLLHAAKNSVPLLAYAKKGPHRLQRKRLGLPRRNNLAPEKKIWPLPFDPLKNPPPLMQLESSEVYNTLQSR